MGTPSEIMGRVTAEARERLEAAPSLVSSREGQASGARRAALLRAIHEVHEGLSRSLAASGDAAGGALAHRIAEPLGALRGDLAGLGEDLHAVDAPALRAALFSQRARRAEPAELVGYAFVIESTRLVRPGSFEAPSFEALRELIDSALGDEAAIEAAARGARRALEGLEAILNALDAPRDQALAEELNPEAGGHSVPSDLREVEAALLAGESSWRRFSYYEARYGARGRRFTRSDSAWLASLARTSENETLSQVLWLGRVLASRGMPRRLLEEHLRVLHRALTGALPDRAERYDALEAASERLREDRTRALPEPITESLVSAHREGLAPELGIEPREAGWLLAAAVADERAGIPHASRSLTDWLLDPSRFSKRWIEAGHRTLESALV